jgi:hypothetical protein
MNLFHVSWTISCSSEELKANKKDRDTTILGPPMSFTFLPIKVKSLRHVVLGSQTVFQGTPTQWRWQEKHSWVALCWWLLATQEAEISRIAAWANNLTLSWKKSWQSGSKCRPWVKPQDCKKKKRIFLQSNSSTRSEIFTYTVLSPFQTVWHRLSSKELHRRGLVMTVPFKESYNLMGFHKYLEFV